MKRYMNFLAIGVMGIIYLMAGPVLAQEDITRDFYGVLNDAENPAGYRDYVEMGCWQCHGFQGQGGRASPLSARLLPYEAFANQVRRPRNVMPAYTQNVLSEDRLRSIYSYLELIPESPDPSEIPLLSGE